MGFHFVLQFTIILNVIWLSCFLQNIESIPVSSSALLIPGITNSSTESEYLKFNSDESKEEKNVSSQVLNNQLEKVTGESTDYAETNANKKKALKNLLSTMMVPYLCDIEMRMCWLNENQGSLVTLFIPIKLLPDQQPPTEIELKELYSLMTKKKKLQMDSLDSSPLKSSEQDQQHSSDAHRRRKRDTQYAEANDNPQQEWANQGENEGYQSFRAQRDVPSTTERDPTSTEGLSQKNVDPQASKQSKRSAEMDEDEVEDKDFGSPSPDDDYQNEDDTEYQPEKRFAGPETTGGTPKSGDSPTKIPSQLYRREVMNPNYNYPFFANPDLYYPSQRLLSPFDGISYRSVDAMPMWYMGGYPAFWQGRATRNPQQYRQAYGRGWPPAPPYFQPFASRYQQPSYPSPAQSQRGHYEPQYPKQTSHNSYRPFSYSYAQGNKNYQTPIRKPIETDANMYYGK